VFYMSARIGKTCAEDVPEWGAQEDVWDYEG
jgi:hypothetical protein